MVRPWEPCEPRASTSNALYGSAAVDLQRALCKGHRDRTADGAEGLMLDAFPAYILPDLVIPEAFVPSEPRTEGRWCMNRRSDAINGPGPRDVRGRWATISV
jgi:hypothetical protein